MNLRERTAVHAALGDEGRLRVVELLSDGDLTVRELGTALGMPGTFSPIISMCWRRLESCAPRLRWGPSEALRHAEAGSPRRTDSIARRVVGFSGVCLQSQLCTLPMRGGVLEFRHRRGSGERGESSQRGGSPDGSSRPRAGHRSECRRPQGIRVDHFRSGRPHLGLRPPDKSHSLSAAPIALVDTRPPTCGQVADFRSAFDEVERRVGHLMKGR